MAQELNSDITVVDQNLLDTMTESERKTFLHNLLRSEKPYILHGVKFVPDSSPGLISVSYNELSEKQKAKLRSQK